MTGEKNCWIKCGVEDGPLKNEKIVVITDIDGKSKRTVCLKDFVDAEYGRVKIRVIYVEENEKERPALIEILGAQKSSYSSEMVVGLWQIMREFSVILDNASIVCLKRLTRWKEIRTNKRLDCGGLVALMVSDLYIDYLDDRSLGDALIEIENIR